MRHHIVDPLVAPADARSRAPGGIPGIGAGPRSGLTFWITSPKPLRTKLVVTASGSTGDTASSRGL
ncbi:MAG: hypothetical protein IPO97_11055 [Sphingomonadales bacterium]|nr:hypothetical protein [Sphingomonadales bacterium]